MAYQVLARKWRPQDFSSLVGQEPIVTSLNNALSEGRIAQAYLFSGIRGVGKTSSARLLAKALNCEQGPTPTPCNECAICKEITAGGDLDVIEVDAATYSKVEQVRELTESLQYGPARDRYKVVILDEIHRLSRQAFDALLKIVEEPPRHLVFIFATTELEAVPATVLSRCQQFRFRRVTSADLAGHLKKIADSEEIQASENALRLIARAGEGSVRDSVALLDQLATFGGGTIEDEDAARLAGGFETTTFARLLGAILDGDCAQVSTLIRQVEADGWEPRHVFAQFLAFCRDGLHLAQGADADGLDLPAEDAEELRSIAGRAGFENFLRLLQLLLSSEASVRHSEAGILALEIALLRAAELPKVTRVEEILKGQGGRPSGGHGPGSAGSGPGPAAPPAGRGRSGSGGQRSLGGRADAVVDSPASPPAPQSAAVDTAEPAAPEPPPRAQSNGLGATVAGLVEHVRAERPVLAAQLGQCPQMRLDGGELLIYCRPDDEMLRSTLEKAPARRALGNALRTLGLSDSAWRIVEAEGLPDEGGLDNGQLEADGAKPSQTQSEAEVLEQAARLPRVKAVIDTFNGEVVAVEPRSADLQDQG